MSIINRPHNIVVFDLDETIGNFTELSVFWEALNKYNSKSLSQEDFITLLETFPDFLRPSAPLKIAKRIFHSNLTG